MLHFQLFTGIYEKNTNTRNINKKEHAHSRETKQHLLKVNYELHHVCHSWGVMQYLRLFAHPQCFMKNNVMFMYHLSV